VLSTIVRLAEKLDRSHCGLVRRAELSKAGKDRVLLSFYSESDCSFEELSILQNRQAFYASFEKELSVNCLASNETN
jgi:hypothetical protein